MIREIIDDVSTQLIAVYEVSLTRVRGGVNAVNLIGLKLRFFIDISDV